MERVTFDSTTKTVKIREDAVLQDGTVCIRPVAHIYSAWKRECLLPGSALVGMGAVADAIGGHPGAPSYVVMRNGWAVQPPNACTRVFVDGLVIDEAGKSPFAKRPDGKDVPVSSVEAPSRLSFGGHAVAVVGSLLTCVLALFFWRPTTKQDPAEPIVAAIAAGAALASSGLLLLVEFRLRKLTGRFQ